MKRDPMKRDPMKRDPMAGPVLHTARLVLRPFELTDTHWVYQTSLDPELARFVSVPEPYEPAHARYFVEQVAMAGWSTGERAEFVIEGPGGRPVGRVGFGLGPGSAEIGYWLTPEGRGHGYATEAARAACRWAFDQLRLEIIEWRAEVGNHASRRVAERVGFTVEATLRKRIVHRGRRVDVWAGSLLPSELERPAAPPVDHELRGAGTPPNRTPSS
jgi:RimJ/RimL family protein N-acetyltransferase